MLGSARLSIRQRSSVSALPSNGRGQTDGRTDRRTLPTYQVHYFPRFAVDNKV